ncbi:MAG TPA: hypothetical protein VIZ90_07770 [Rhizobiaceae bacterium]
MKPQILSCAMVALALSVSIAWADEIKPADGTVTPAVASKIIGNGVMPDGRECVVGTTPDCAAKDAEVVADGKIIGNGVMPDGGVCILGTTPACAAPRNAVAASRTIAE